VEQTSSTISLDFDLAANPATKRWEGIRNILWQLECIMGHALPWYPLLKTLFLNYLHFSIIEFYFKSLRHFLLIKQRFPKSGHFHKEFPNLKGPIPILSEVEENIRHLRFFRHLFQNSSICMCMTVSGYSFTLKN